MRVSVRLFAAAREAVGAAELDVELDDGATAASLLGALGPDPATARVLRNCSLLVDGVAASGGSVLVDGARIDVLPPFAGG